MKGREKIQGTCSVNLPFLWNFESRDVSDTEESPQVYEKHYFYGMVEEKPMRNLREALFFRYTLSLPFATMLPFIFFQVYSLFCNFAEHISA